MQLKSLKPEDSTVRRTVRVTLFFLRTNGRWVSLDTLSQKTRIAPNILGKTYLPELIAGGWIEEGPGNRYRLTHAMVSMQVIQGLKSIRLSEGV